jgi:hypothetical protein
LDLGVNPNLGLDPVSLRRRIANVRVSTSSPVSVAFTILSFHDAGDLAQGLGGGRGEPWDANSPLDAARLEARHASSEETRACEERERSVRHRTGGEKMGDGGLP